MSYCSHFSKWLAIAVTIALPCTGNAAPDEIRYGKNAGYPNTGSRRIITGEDPQYLVGNFTSVAKRFPHGKIAASVTPRALVETAAVRSPLSANLKARLEQYLQSFPITGMLILQENQLLFEAYQYGRTKADQFHGNSMSKTILASAIGIAIGEGKIRSVQDQAQDYVPELAGTLHGGTKLKDLLQMATGAAYAHKLAKDGGDIDEVYTKLLASDSDSLALVREWNTRAEPAGTKFNYNELGPMTLSHVLRRATGTSLSAYVEEKLWKPMGAESDATWAMDSKGAEMACVGFSATLRDWGRFGLLLANKGRYLFRQVIPADWLERATTLSPTDRHVNFRPQGHTAGYGYLTWISSLGEGRVFSLRGGNGQRVIVAPDLNLVFVQTGVEIDQTEPMNNSLFSTFRAIMAELRNKKVH